MANGGYHQSLSVADVAPRSSMKARTRCCPPTWVKLPTATKCVPEGSTANLNTLGFSLVIGTVPVIDSEM